MNHSANAVAKIKTIQTGLRYLALMQFTAYMWPQQAIVEDGACFDYIIVGAGTAGSVIAKRLTENEDINVLLIEAGGDPPVESVVPTCNIFLQKSRFDWNYTSENDEYTKKCHQKPFSEITLGKMLGGTSSLNYLLYSRGYPIDYDNWANMTKDSTWKWENVLPYFKKSEKIENLDFLRSKDIANHGTDGLMGLTIDKRHSEHVKAVLEGFNELGSEIVNDPVSGLGYSKPLLIIGTGGRQSSSFAFLRPAKESKNLHVLKNTLVTRIKFDKNKNAIGVEAILDDGKTITIKATKEVIVSAGTFNSAKLLMLSGIGPKKDLECKNINVISDLPVGKNLQDHIGVFIPFKIKKSKPTPLDPNQHPATPVIGYTALEKCQNYPDYQSMLFLAQAEMVLFFCSFAYRLSYEICDKNHESMTGLMGLFNEIVHLHPKSRGEVKLKSLNPMDPPIISSGYLSDEADLNDLVKYIKDYIPIVNTTHFKGFGAEMIDPKLRSCCEFANGSDEYWKCYASCMSTGLSNFAGTCAMGSVVDSRLRVIGVQRLRVADASIMPVITRGNTNGPVVMIAEKAADFIKEDSKKKC